MTTSSDSNYRADVAAATAQAAQADADVTAIQRLRSQLEQDLADITARKEQATAAADNMQAQDVDPGTLSEQMDLVDALTRAETALAAMTESMELAEKEVTAAGDCAEAVKSGLERRHSGLAEAHEEAPVRAAERTYYENG